LNCASRFDRHEATLEANTRLAEPGKLRMRALVVYGDVVSFAARFAVIGGVRAHRRSWRERAPATAMAVIGGV
jgi:hypothetical protein